MGDLCLVIMVTLVTMVTVVILVNMVTKVTCNHGNPQIPDSAEILLDGTLVMSSTDSSLTDVYQCTTTNSYDNETVSADVQVKGKSGFCYDCLF